jgi:Sec-independent protein translocase protein TatA
MLRVISLLILLVFGKGRLPVMLLAHKALKVQQVFKV